MCIPYYMQLQGVQLILWFFPGILENLPPLPGSPRLLLVEQPVVESISGICRSSAPTELARLPENATIFQPLNLLTVSGHKIAIKHIFILGIDINTWVKI